MSSKSSLNNLLESDHILLAKILWERLKPNTWPFDITDLPIGTALVGGAVRDGLLNKLKNQPDLDLVVPNNSIEVSQKLAQKGKGKLVVLDTQREIIRLVFNNWTIDIAPQEGDCLKKDLLRRDFTINAIALTLNGTPQLLDPTGGIQNLQKKLLVAISEQNIIDDPLRSLRAMRLMAELDFDIHPTSKEWIKKHRQLITKAAPERIQSELMRLVRAEWADEVIPLIKEINLLSPWKQTYDLYKEKIPSKNQAKEFTKSEIKMALPLAFLTHLLTDEGIKNLHFSKKLRKQCTILRQWQNKNDDLSYKTLSEKDRLQLHKDLETYLPALILGIEESKKKQWLKRWRNKKDTLFHPASPLDGNNIKRSLNMPSSKQMGELIDHLCLERAFGRVHNEQQAIQEARHWLQHKKTKKTLL